MYIETIIEKKYFFKLPYFYQTSYSSFQYNKVNFFTLPVHNVIAHKKSNPLDK